MTLNLRYTSQAVKYNGILNIRIVQHELPKILLYSYKVSHHNSAWSFADSALMNNAFNAMINET